MKAPLFIIRFSLVIALVMLLVVSFNGCSKKEEPKPNVTIGNLKLAYLSEVKHASWYEAFAKQAQKENLGEVAVMFRALSQSEKVHADNMANLLKAKGVEAVAPTALIPQAEARQNDFNLSPSRYVSTGDETEVLPLDEAVVLLQEAEEERAEADRQLDKVLGKLGFKGWRNG